MAEDDRQEIGSKAYGDYDRHKVLVHFGYSFGGFILTAVVDYLFLWPENHLYALLAMAAWLSVTAIVELTVWGFQRWITAGAVGALFLSAIVAYRAVGPIPPPPPTTGWLQAANEPTPPNGCHPPGKNDVLVVLGTLGVTMSDPALKQIKKVAIQLGECPLVSMQVGENGALIDANLYDAAGNPVGQIRNNGFSIPNNNGLVIEKSGDLSTLVVHTSNGQELLYVRYLNRSTFRVRGLFSCAQPRLRRIRITDEAILGTANFEMSCSASNGGVGYMIH